MTKYQNYAILPPEVKLTPCRDLPEMDVRSYLQRILALDDEFRKSRRTLDRLERQVRFKPASVRKNAFNAQLGLARLRTRLVKEESAFYARLGQQYDAVRLLDGIVELLDRRDPDMTLEILEELEEKISKEED